MTNFGCNKLGIIIWFCAVLSTFALSDASTSGDTSDGGNGDDKYAEIIPQEPDADPLDSFAYSLLVEHLKRPPSRISTNGEPIEHAYYVIDTHRKPDGSPVHPLPEYGAGSSDAEVSASSNVPSSRGPSQQSSATISDLNTASSINQPQMMRYHYNQKQNGGEAPYKVSINNTTTVNNGHQSQPIAQGIHPSDIDIAVRDAVSSSKEIRNNVEPEKHNAPIPNPFSTKIPHNEQKLPSQNSVEDAQQKDTNSTSMQALSERLTKLSQSLKRLQMLTNPSPAADEPQTLSKLAASVVQSFGGASSPLSHFLTFSTPSSPMVNQPQPQPTQSQNEPQKVSHPEEPHTQMVEPSTTLSPSPPPTQGPGVLEQGIPTNLNEEMAALEESLRNSAENEQHQQQLQSFAGSYPSNDQIQAQNQFVSHQHPTQNSQRQPIQQTLPPSTTQIDNDKVTNGSAFDPSPAPDTKSHVLYHHSVSRKIPDLEMEKVINDPDILSHTIHYSQENQPQNPASRIIFKNKYFNVQSETGGHGPQQPFQYSGNPVSLPTPLYIQPVPSSSFTTPHQHFGPPRSRPPIMSFSMDNVLQRAVQVLNNYNDVFLNKMVNSNAQYQKYLKPIAPNHLHYPHPPPVLPNPVVSKNPKPLHIVDAYQKISTREKEPPIFPHIANNFPGYVAAIQSKSVPHPQKNQFRQPPIYPAVEVSKPQQKPAFGRVTLGNGPQKQERRPENFESPKNLRAMPKDNSEPTHPSFVFHNELEDLVGSASINPSPNVRHGHQVSKQVKNELKYPIIPTPESVSAPQSAKYSTIFLRSQGGGPGGARISQRFWHRTSQEVQRGEPVSKPLNYQVFKDFGKVF